MRISILVVLFSFSIMGFAQILKPAMEGMFYEQSPAFFKIKFKENGPLGKDWIYGSYLDEDSLTRCVAFREGGRWVSLPFSGYYGNKATDLVMWGDTLCIAGDFQNVLLHTDSSYLPSTTLIKLY